MKKKYIWTQVGAMTNVKFTQINYSEFQKWISELVPEETSSEDIFFEIYIDETTTGYNGYYNEVVADVDLILSVRKEAPSKAKKTKNKKND